MTSVFGDVSTLSEHLNNEQDMTYRSAMLREAMVFLAGFKRFFDHIRLDHETENRLRETSKKGTLVYVMRTHSSTLDYLFFNYLFLRVGLPLARFANGINLTFFKDSVTGLAIDGIDFSEKGSLSLGVDQLEGTHSATRIRVDLHAGPRAHIRTPRKPRFHSTARRCRELEKNPFLMPQLISWPRKPASKRQTLWDIFFGDRLASGKLKNSSTLSVLTTLHRLALESPSISKK